MNSVSTHSPRCLKVLKFSSCSPMDSVLLACYEVAPSLCEGFRHAARTPRKRLNMDSASKRSKKRKGAVIGCASCLTLSLHIQNSRFHRVIGTWFATLFCEQDQQVRGSWSEKGA